MGTINEYEKARVHAIESLEKALVAHENRDIFSIDDNLDEYDKLIPRDDIPANSLLFITLEFWSSWSDSAIHDWKYHEPLSKDDWPRLAKILIEDLKLNREVTNFELLTLFSVNIDPVKGSWFIKMFKKILKKQP